MVDPDSRSDSQSFVTSFARGLAVIEAFRGRREPMRLAEVARLAGVDRAVARRLLLTLAALGFVTERDHRYRLTPRILRLGYSYLANAGLDVVLQPFLNELADQVGESCSVSVLDDTESVSVAHATSPTHRMGMILQVGSRWPAYIMASGRVLLSGRSDIDVAELIARSELKAFTDRTITDPEELLEEVRATRSRGYAIIDEELDRGLLSIAVPIRNALGEIRASLNASSSTTRTNREALIRDFLPIMQRMAYEIARVLP